MSFDYNPLKHIELVDDPPKEEYSNSMDPDTYAVYCHSCGSSKDRIAKDAACDVAFTIMRNHVKKAHSSKMKHFDSWSIY